MDSIFIDDDIDTNIDLMKLLRTRENDPSKKSELNKKYTDVYMIFDLEPHDRKFDPARIRKMLSHYNDSSNNGKLFLNYPMVESFRHIRSEKDDGFKERTYPLTEMKNYKKTVNDESWNRLKMLNQYDAELFRIVISLHLMKAHYLKTGDYELPTVDDYLSDDGSTIFDIQLDKMSTTNTLYVLNTCIFNMIDYAPNAMLDQLKDTVQMMKGTK